MYYGVSIKVHSNAAYDHVISMLDHMLTSISQLLADHCSITSIPGVITHCSPLVVDAHLHSTFILGGASHETDITISAGDTHISYSEWECYMCITDKDIKQHTTTGWPCIRSSLSELQ